ncbi:hypothetical protein MNBD_NITROSPINAE02-1449 [hydrothermal vent metagenome]|uniref:Uncharacterized protein n=1 Tax=hydrothermal vent metagenome TaxID=652676 RepID=A0A3B1C848_9ZZZZ
MKIDGLGPIEGRPVGQPGANKPVKGPSFHEVLDGITQPGSTKQAGKAGQSGPVPLAPFIQPLPISSSTASQRDAIGSIDNILTDLDMFRNALANDDIPLERLEPLARELAARKDDLASLLGSAPDEELKGIVSSALELVINQMNQYHAGYAA